MTDQINLGLTWASAGGVTAVTTTKYENGWVSEVPTYQNFNYMVQGLDQNILHLAESGNYDWQNDINYKAGVSVVSPLGSIFTAKADNVNIDPDTDPGNSSWVNGQLVGSDFGSLVQSDGSKVALPVRANLLYTGVDQTVVNNVPLIELRTTAATDNLAVANVAGELVVSNLGQAGPDSRNLAKDTANTKRIFHEGHEPLVSEVVGAVEEAPTDGKSYARVGVSAVSGNWVAVTSTVVQTAPPPPVNGAGQGWYNLDDGQHYLDINDGDSSQWVLANPPLVPEVNAVNVSYDDTTNNLGATVQAALDALAAGYPRNHIVNPSMAVHQDFTSTNGVATTPTYVTDEWFSEQDSLSSLVIMDGKHADGNQLKVLSEDTMGSTELLQAHTQVLEADSVYGLNGKDIVISAVVTVTNWSGVLAITLFNSDKTRSRILEVPVTSGVNNIFEVVTLEADTVLVDEQGVAGLTVSFGNCATGIYQTTSSSGWIAGKYYATDTTTKWVEFANAELAVTDVDLYLGNKPRVFQPSSYAEDLVACQRYFIDLLGGEYGSNEPVIGACCYNNNDNYAVFEHTQLCQLPTLNYTNTTHFTVFEDNAGNACDSVNSSAQGLSRNEVEFRSTGNQTAGNSSFIRTNHIDARLALNARLS